MNTERYIKTMEFFNQLREPERNQAIANYNEEYDYMKIPDNLFIALEYGFSWEDSNEGHNYWENICGNIEDNSYFNKQEAVHCPTQKEFDSVTKSAMIGADATKGFVVPALTYKQRNALPNPITTGTMIRSAEDSKIYTFINDSWNEVTETQWTHDN
jgi:hypothetical protein